MFTGIVEETGTVAKINRFIDRTDLIVRARTCGRGLKIGDSLAVNGCCLTAVKIQNHGKSKLVSFNLLNETWKRTNLQFTRTGSKVNLERALLANGRLSGHFVTGHIDGLGRIARWERSGSDHVLDIIPPEKIMRYVVAKGSIAIDGVSLTVAAVRKNSFRIWIIPHTFEVTGFAQRKAGDSVNIEVDLLGKYVERFVTCSKAAG
jgi:riboflavin synthase